MNKNKITAAKPPTMELSKNIRNSLNTYNSNNVQKRVGKDYIKASTKGMLIGLCKKTEILDQEIQSITKDKGSHLITLRGFSPQEDRCL